MKMQPDSLNIELASQYMASSCSTPTERKFGQGLWRKDVSQRNQEWQKIHSDKNSSQGWEKWEMAILAYRKAEHLLLHIQLHYCTERGTGRRRAKCSVKWGTFCYYLQVENPRNKIHQTAPLNHKNETKSVVCGFANPQGQEIQRMLSTYIFRGLNQSACPSEEKCSEQMGPCLDAPEVMPQNGRT